MENFSRTDFANGGKLNWRIKRIHLASKLYFCNLILDSVSLRAWWTCLFLRV